MAPIYAWTYSLQAVLGFEDGKTDNFKDSSIHVGLELLYYEIDRFLWLFLTKLGNLPARV